MQDNFALQSDTVLKFLKPIMPFTFSHPAAAVPLTRMGLVLSALVVGAMSPDFAYFIFLSARYQIGHTLLGIIIFDIPVGFVVLWLFHTILKQPLISLFPVTHQQRLMPLANDFSFLPLQRFVSIILSLSLGAFTHIAWDSLTHLQGWTVQQLPVLSAPVIEIAQVSIRLYKILQHGSTVFGAALLLYWYLKWLKQAPTQPINLSVPLLSTRTKLYIIIIIGLGATIGAIVYSFLVPPYSIHQFLLQTVIVAVAILFVEVIIFGIFWHVNQLKI